MGWVSGIAVYIVIWWLVIFMVLPWGVQPIERGDVEKGHAASAPLRPRMLRKSGDHHVDLGGAVADRLRHHPERPDFVSHLSRRR